MSFGIGQFMKVLSLYLKVKRDADALALDGKLGVLDVLTLMAKYEVEINEMVDSF